jgi:Asp-tRNA(Asn)/Glu-tRNA(Gln) amidotransferase A subunit family amidase
MCLAAFGSQTSGSLLRPAAYNGLVGLKATYGRISAEGVIPVSWNLDHMGAMTRCVEDANIIWKQIRDGYDPPFGRMPWVQKGHEKRISGIPPQLGRIKEFFEKDASPEVVEHLEIVREMLAKSGAVVLDLKLPSSYDSMMEWHRLIRQTELACYHRALFETHHDQYPPLLKASIESGLTISGHQYVQALQKRIDFQKEMGKILASVDASFMPTAPSTAPMGLSSTGSAAFNLPWSLCGFPTMTLPSGLDKQGLPFGIQLVTAPMAEKCLLNVAKWCEDVLGFNAKPE